MTDQQWLTREQIDEVVASVSAGDLVDALPEGAMTESGATRMAVAAFDAAAHRIGTSNGVRAMERVRAADFRYLAQRMGELTSISGPLSSEQGDSQPSAITGE